MDHTKINGVLLSMGVKNLNKTIVREGRQHRYTGEIGSDRLWIDVFLVAGAKCTLSPQSGGLSSAFISAADAILAGCRFAETARLEESFPGVTSTQVDELIESLRARDVNIEEESENSIYRLVRFSGPLGDKLTVKIFKSGTLQLQGIHGQVAGWAVAALSEMLPVDALLERQKRIYKIDISVAQINENLACRVPHAHSILHPSNSIQLASSLALTQTVLELEDYAVLAFPALKALEGFAFQLINENFTPPPTKMQKFGDYVHLVNGRFEIVSLYQGAASSDVLRALEKCYALWYNNRHALFHMEQVLDSTRLVERREDAIDIVNKVLDLIESSCQRIY
ncbi:RNase LS family HEPN domain-containing protein [Xanthomonas dyei]|uniref:RNase LS family HEPN domain-containing protein n=1 Tax=Xanthomonas dyei TaxID=743699 RepID=UPI001E475DD5|nr:RNase LS family HEPN domain-containing protein [Xanthomonas dyei]MCC4632796.1 RNase LS family HEPN domain-containing protein [Xanthomonas dyei pv. eucalypti]